MDKDISTANTFSECSSDFNTDEIEFIPNKSETDILNKLYPRMNEEVGIGYDKILLKKPKTESKGLTIRPYIDIVDLNNSKDEPYLNKPVNSIIAGIKITW